MLKLIYQVLFMQLENILEIIKIMLEVQNTQQETLPLMFLYTYMCLFNCFLGKQNFYALREQAMPRDYAQKVVEQTHHHWMGLHLERKQHTVSKETVVVTTSTTTTTPDVPPADVTTDSKAPISGTEN